MRASSEYDRSAGQARRDRTLEESIFVILHEVTMVLYYSLLCSLLVSALRVSFACSEDLKNHLPLAKS